MKLPLIYGLGIAFTTSVLALISHLTGLSTDPDKMMIGAAAGLAGLLFAYIVGIVLGTRRARLERGAAGYSYGQAFATGMLISLFAALGGVVFNFIYFKFLSPDFAEIQIAATRSFMERMNMPADKMEDALAQMRVQTTLVSQLRGGFIFAAVLGTIIALIVAAVVKRPATNAAAELPPAFT